MKAKQFMWLNGFAMLAFMISQPALCQNNETETFVVVDEMPAFKDGGIKEFALWVNEQIKYPEEALKEGVSGKVFVRFVVNEKGQVQDLKVMKSVDDRLSEEVTRVLKLSPDWTPGKHQGKKVRVAMTIPVDFKLDQPKVEAVQKL